MQPLQIVAFVPLAFAAKMRRIERRTVAQLRQAGALDAAGAIQLHARGRIARFVFRRLERSSVLHGVGNDRYYLSESAYGGFRAARRRRALAVVGALLLAGALLYSGGTFS